MNLEPGPHGMAYFSQEIRDDIARRVHHKDIDRFKKLNDTYGHAVGDRILCKMTRLLEDTLRDKTDRFARLGGEEFGIILPETSASQVAVLVSGCAKRLRERILTLQVTPSRSPAVWALPKDCRTRRVWKPR